MKTPAPPLDEDPAVAVYDGRLLLGFIFDRATGCIATDSDRRPIGASPPGGRHRAPSMNRAPSRCPHDRAHRSSRSPARRSAKVGRV